ncbi:MAG: methyltransferase, partial [Candidatus Thorarchaeota archaeon]|nr:methyltransferase [Candidatus Thorarchaeota archaeon]
MSHREHALSFMLPLLVTIIVPVILWYLSIGIDTWFAWPAGFERVFITLGALVILSGLILLYGTVQKFANEGEGTLSLLHPTQKLVISGIYRHMRNPMITGVLLILLGESVLFFSFFVLAWFLFFFVGLYMVFKNRKSL